MCQEHMMERLRDPDFCLPKLEFDGIKIHIDPDRCTNPEDCLLCMRACSPKVFALLQGVPACEHSEARSPQVWCNMPELCTVCNRCVEACPHHAIHIHVGD